MITFILVTIFCIYSTIESAAYAFYEIKCNKNKPGGITLLMLSLVGLIFPFFAYLAF